MKNNKELKEKIVKEYLAGGTSFNELSRKYGYAGQSICEWVREYEGKGRIRINKPSKVVKEPIEELPKDVKILQDELRRTSFGTRYWRKLFASRRRN